MIWFRDNLPEGSVKQALGGDRWEWGNSNPYPHLSSRYLKSASVNGLHFSSFYNALHRPFVPVGGVFHIYTYLDPQSKPRELMIQFASEERQWSHRAYWGENLINYGIEGTASRQYLGLLPTIGEWVKLEIPASKIELENQTVHGLGFMLYNGRAFWDSVHLQITDLNTHSHYLVLRAHELLKRSVNLMRLSTLDNITYEEVLQIDPEFK